MGYGTLSLAQIQALSEGQNPLTVCPGQIAAYYPLRNTLEDLGPSRRGLTTIGATVPVWSNHPNIALPPRRRIFAASSVSTTLTGLGSTLNPTAKAQAAVGESLAVKASTINPTAKSSMAIGVAINARPTTSVPSAKGQAAVGVSVNARATTLSPTAKASLNFTSSSSVVSALGTTIKPTARATMALGVQSTIKATTVNPTARATMARGVSASARATILPPIAIVSLKIGESLSAKAQITRPSAKAQITVSAGSSVVLVGLGSTLRPRCVARGLVAVSASSARTFVVPFDSRSCRIGYESRSVVV